MGWLGRGCPSGGTVDFDILAGESGRNGLGMGVHDGISRVACGGGPCSDSNVPSTGEAHAGAGMQGSAKVTRGTRSAAKCAWAATAPVSMPCVIYDVQAVW
jgi:hypothetical protein